MIWDLLAMSRRQLGVDRSSMCPHISCPELDTPTIREDTGTQMELEPEVVIFCLLFVFLECLEGPQLKTVKNIKLIKIGICEKEYTLIELQEL